MPIGRFHHARVAARHGVRRFAMRLGAARHVHVEQVNLVVSRRALSVGLVDQARRRHATVGVLAQRHRAADDPYLEAPGGVRKEVLDSARTVGLGDRALVAAVEAHEGEVFRAARPARRSARAASARNRPAASRLASISWPEVIWIAATRMRAIYGAPFAQGDRYAMSRPWQCSARPRCRAIARGALRALRPSRGARPNRAVRSRRARRARAPASARRSRPATPARSRP